MTSDQVINSDFIDSIIETDQSVLFSVSSSLASSISHHPLQKINSVIRPLLNNLKSKLKIHPVWKEMSGEGVKRIMASHHIKEEAKIKFIKCIFGYYESETHLFQN